MQRDMHRSGRSRDNGTQLAEGGAKRNARLRSTAWKPLALTMFLLGAVACSSDADDPNYWNTAGSGGDAGSGGATAGSSGGGSAGASGGTSGTGGGTSGTGGGTSGGTCSVEQPGATGSEPGGLIPVCCAPTAAEKADIDGVFALLNEHRANNGVGPLAYDNQLEAAIQGHCIHMAAHPFFDHSAPESSVSSPWTRAEMCGTSAGGENIANGQSSPADVMSSWIGSSGHNANMLDPDFTRVGIGRHGSYWGQIFGR